MSSHTGSGDLFICVIIVSIVEATDNRGEGYDDDIEYDATDSRGEGQGKERRNVMSLQTLHSTPPIPCHIYRGISVPARSS